MEIYIDNMKFGKDKIFYTNQINLFANTFAKRVENAKRFEFCKQDIRGSLSISIIDDSGLSLMQRHFENKLELIGYVVGFNKAMSNESYL